MEVFAPGPSGIRSWVAKVKGVLIWTSPDALQNTPPPEFTGVLSWLDACEAFTLVVVGIRTGEKAWQAQLPASGPPRAKFSVDLQRLPLCLPFWGKLSGVKWTSCRLVFCVVSVLA